MEIRVYLDGVLFDDPTDYADLTLFIERDETIKGLLKKYTNKFTFTGDAYLYLLSVKDDNLSNQVLFRIEYLQTHFETLFEGIINITDVQFSLYPVNTASLIVEDSAFTTLINNNKKITTRVSGYTKSKNNVTITPAATTNIDMFNTLTGSYDYTDGMHTVDECFRFLIAFMTDDQVDYESPVFGVGGELENYALTTGSSLNLAVNSGFIFEINFEDLFTEMNKRFNISFHMDYSGTRTKIIIDKTSNIFDTSESIFIDSPSGVVESYDKSGLYSIVKFGGTHIINDGSPYSNYPEYKFIGFKQEEYLILGQMNVDLTLDLEKQYIDDHNVISQVLVNLNSNYDENIFVIELDPLDLTKAKQYDTYNVGIPPYFYNLSLTNEATANNYFGFIPSSLASYLSDNIDTFKAGLTADLLIPTGVVIWDKDTAPEGEDLGGNYNIANGRYTAPTTGSFNISTNFKYYLDSLVLSSVASGTELVRVFFKRYDSGSTLLETFTLPSIYNNTPSIYGYFFTYGIFMNATDYITMECEADYAAVYITINAYDDYSHYMCLATPDEGGIYIDYSLRDYRIINYDFDYPINLIDIQTMLSNEKKKIRFALNNINYSGWIKKAVIKFIKGIVSLTLMTSQNDNN